MRISSVNQSPSMSGAAGMSSGDAATRSLQKQIADKQKQLQEISKRDDLSNEEKMKQRQELLKEIADLNGQLRQHEVELRREQQQQRESGSMEPMSGKADQDGKNENERGTDFSLGGMKSLLSADSSLKQAKIQGSVKANLEGRAGVLRGEIKLDSGRRVSAEAKEAELASIENKAQQAGAAQIDTLAKANEALAEAKTEEKENPKTSGKKDDLEEKEVKTETQREAEDAAGIKDNDEAAVMGVSIDIFVGGEMDKKLSNDGASVVDIRL